MMTLLEAKLDVPAGTPGPDTYDPSTGRIPSDDFVVTRRRDGSTASVFKDLIWDYSAYTPDKKVKRVHFKFWGEKPETQSRYEISIEIRLIMFCLIWRRQGAPLAIGTLRNYVTVLCACAALADAKSVTLSTFLSSHKAVNEFVKNGASGWMAETLASLLVILAKVSEADLGFVLVGEKCIKEIKRHNKHYRSILKQHPPIPTRIYSHFLASLKQELSSWFLVADDMLHLFNACGFDPRLGRSSNRQPTISKEHGLIGVLPNFEEIATPACIAYLTSKGKPPNLSSVSTVIGQVQLIAKLIAQAYTGMRDDEASTLPYRCYEQTTINARNHHFVVGRTTKFNHGLVKKTRWVTSGEAIEALKAAQAIADAVYSVFDVFLEKSSLANPEYPLFVSLRYMGFAGHSIVPKDGHFEVGDMQGRELPEACLLTITEDDLKELEQIDPYRAWRSEPKFQIGMLWSFTSHQLRRSLALYAQRSGLVSLPSLRRQLKHITEEMARYYARGSQFAKNFIGTDKKHFGIEWQKTQPESAALSYILNVLLNEEQLFGGHATWVEHRQKNPDGEILIDRALTLKRFQRGEMAYRETILGGCTSTDTCNNAAIRWLHVDCLRDNCKNLVCSAPKLSRVIAAQTKMLERMDQSSVEFRTEQQDLLTLETALTKANSKLRKM
jgi:hypothetical protein